MALGEAKNKAKLEFQNVLSQTGLSLEDCRAFVDEHPEMKRPMYHVPHAKGTIGMAANFVRHIKGRMMKEGWQPKVRELAAAVN
jgi:hypothetical protein